MKILHCADVHLDSKMESNLSSSKARERNHELFRTFSNMVTYAKKNGVSVVIIAGDLFDTSRVTSKTADMVIDTIRNADEIDFLYLAGNHDEANTAFRAKHFPNNFKRFSESWTYFRYGDTVIAGIEMSKDNAFSLYNDLSLSEKDKNIVIMHGQVSSSAGDGLVCLPKLYEKHIDYLALGHLHSFAKGTLGDGLYCYSGCLEGRGFDECGDKGFVIVDDLKPIFVPVAMRKHWCFGVDITGLLTNTELITKIKKIGTGADKHDLVKYVLTGKYTLEAQFDIQFVLKQVESLHYYVKIEDESKLYIDKADYSNDISLKGEFVRKVLASDYSDEDKARIIKCGLNALLGEAVII